MPGHYLAVALYRRGGTELELVIAQSHLEEDKIMTENDNTKQRPEGAKPVGFFKTDGTLDSEAIVKSIRESAAKTQEQKPREAGAE